MRENWQGRSDLVFKLKWGLKNLDADGGNGHREKTNNSNAGKTTNDRSWFAEYDAIEGFVRWKGANDLC